MAKKTGRVLALIAMLGAFVFALWGNEDLYAVIKPKVFTQFDSFKAEQVAASFPSRVSNMLSGQEFMKKIANLPQRRREAAIVAEILAGNVPDHLRVLQPVKLLSKDRYGKVVTATLWALSDYLAVGSSSDYVRTPLSFEAASRLALQLGMGLPTTKMVDDVYRAATFKLSPDPLPPTSEMTSVAYFLRHDLTIRRQMQQMNGLDSLDHFVAGHKKDVVVSQRLERRKDRVAIFGWHRPSGRPIQPLNTSHGRLYADYSHGVRLIRGQVFVDGQLIGLDDALNDRLFSPLFSYEGRFSTYAEILENAAHGGQNFRSKLPSLFALQP